MKTESVEDFVKRGGVIKKIPPQPEKTEKLNIQNTEQKLNITDAMTLADAQFYFAQKSKRKSKAGARDEEEQE
jgi:hypothetical protein